MTRRRLTSIAFALTTLGACDASDPPPRWNYIHAAILQPNCTTSACHSDLTAIAGLPLGTADEAYNVLTGRVCGEPVNAGVVRSYVYPYAPEQSQLIARLRGDAIDVMPPDRPLPEVEIDLVYRWIEEGAACD